MQIRYAFVGVVLAACAGSLCLTGCDLFSEEEGPEITIQDIEVGSGDEAAEGMFVAVRYTAQLTDLTVVDSNVDAAEPLTFRVGFGIPTQNGYRPLIKGFDLGVRGMKEGGRRRITVPPELAYGSDGLCAAQGDCAIPPNSTLIFEIELVNAWPPDTA